MSFNKLAKFHFSEFMHLFHSYKTFSISPKPFFLLMTRESLWKQISRFYLIYFVIFILIYVRTIKSRRIIVKSSSYYNGSFLFKDVSPGAAYLLCAHNVVIFIQIRLHASFVFVWVLFSYQHPWTQAGPIF